MSGCVFRLRMMPESTPPSVDGDEVYPGMYICVCVCVFVDVFGSFFLLSVCCKKKYESQGGAGKTRGRNTMNMDTIVDKDMNMDRRRQKKKKYTSEHFVSQNTQWTMFSWQVRRCLGGRSWMGKSGFVVPSDSGCACVSVCECFFLPWHSDPRKVYAIQ